MRLLLARSIRKNSHSYNIILFVPMLFFVLSSVSHVSFICILAVFISFSPFSIMLGLSLENLKSLNSIFSNCTRTSQINQQFYVKINQATFKSSPRGTYLFYINQNVQNKAPKFYDFKNSEDVVLKETSNLNQHAIS